jgi:nucleotide-binding universal stress UspA family protein
MFERILLPLDGSEVAEAALPYAEQLAGRLGSEVVLHHVRGDERSLQEHMHQAYLDRLAETVRSNIKKFQTSDAPVKVTTRVEVGDARESICNLVDSSKVDLIIMTAVSASGLKVGRMLGSVADHVCRTVPIPVLLIRPQSVRELAANQPLITRLLIPLDGSQLAALALPTGLELAARLEASITLFQMARMIRLYDDGMASSAGFNYARFDEEEKARVTAEMTALESDVKKKGLEVTSLVISGFDAASEIIEAEKKVNADLTVMSTHGRSGPSRWVLGSVAERVLRHGETPLLLVHASGG